jgi:hypothetical protein
MLKAQLMTIFSVRQDSNIYSLIYGILMISLIDYVVKVIPSLTEYIKGKIEKKVSTVHLSIPIKETVKSRIVFRKNFKNKTDDQTIDAILDHLSKIDSSLDLDYSGLFMVNNKEEFSINADIRCKIISSIFKDDLIDTICFEIFSENLSLTKLKKWVDDITVKYVIDKKNKFGSKLFYFSEIDTSNEPVAPSALLFNITEFNTNKNLSNVYGEQIDVLRKRVELFGNKAWYEKRGIPHTLGVFLSGPPGTGKTSVIKAISNTTKRHVFSLSLRKTSTQTQMRDLFYNESVRVKINDQYTTITIPLANRIYVFEDVDCLSDILLERKEVVKEDKTEFESQHGFSATGKKINTDVLTLSFLLNLFDGILETPGRILIMSSNHPEKIDKAVLRPGRIDLLLNLGYCTPKTIREMFQSFYEREFTEMDFDIFKETSITPARVQEILSNNVLDSEIAYKILVNL